MLSTCENDLFAVSGFRTIDSIHFVNDITFLTLMRGASNFYGVALLYCTLSEEQLTFHTVLVDHDLQ